MPFSCKAAIFMLVATIILFLLRKRLASKVSYTDWSWTVTAGLFVLLLFIACFKQVGTKEEGVKLSFGKPVGRLSAGPHLTWPWIKVKEMDAAVQTDTFDGHHCLKVRIAFQQTACARVSLQWRIRVEATDELYQNYRSFVHVRDALVTRKLNVALNEALAHYNPLNLKAQPLPEISRSVSRIMRREVGARIEVLSTLLPLLTFDADTQTRINQLQQQIAATRIARQEKLTNKAKAKANNALAESVSATPNVLVARCFETLEEMVKRSQVVPAGFSCWPGSSSFGGVVATTDAMSKSK